MPKLWADHCVPGISSIHVEPQIVFLADSSHSFNRINPGSSRRPQSRSNKYRSESVGFVFFDGTLERLDVHCLLSVDVDEPDMAVAGNCRTLLD